MYVFQPANSPLTNVKDVCVFPCMSKAVTEQQSLTKHSQLLEGEELWSIANKVYDDLPADTVARSYAGHHQMVNAIAHCEGGDEFAKARGGLHFGIRKHCIPFFSGDTDTEPAGVSLIEEYDNLEGSDANHGLKYPAPDTSSLVMADYLNYQERTFLLEHFPSDSEQWMELATHDLTEAMESGDL